MNKQTWDSDMDENPEPLKSDALTDQSIMWFGKHKGKMLSQIPNDYFSWLYDAPGRLDPRLKEYIKNNWDVINRIK